jgi:DNA-directed RNA polymerase subunit M/transcription elongation factor TFIIS
MISKENRKKTYHLIHKLFKSSISKLIEYSIYKFSKEYAINNNTEFLMEEIYKSKSDDMLCILNKNIKHIKLLIKNKTLDPSRIAYMKQSDLNLEQYANIIKKKEIDRMLSEPIPTTAFECKKCNKRKCNVIEKQVLSADEPATQFITCLECGHVFMT